MDAETKEWIKDIRDDVKDIKRCQIEQGKEIIRLATESSTAEKERNRLNRKVNRLSGFNYVLIALGSFVAYFLSSNK